ncbi:hypothetical protein BIY29_06330 [Brenneria alni]|uniref:Uncharacterized protein n=1 Tax=Brenneria alni TaxID=71656 RepID=A0A421DQQ3_9GAMM|nr:hypothetical protein BIY29_06330 [Brenneria alni]
MTELLSRLIHGSGSSAKEPGGDRWYLTSDACRINAGDPLKVIHNKAFEHVPLGIEVFAEADITRHLPTIIGHYNIPAITHLCLHSKNEKRG